MPTQGLDIGLQIRNNTNYPQQINVMGNPANLLDTANATTEYRWDLTGFVITFENTISVQYKRNIDPTFDIFTWDLDGSSLQSVVIALNNLGIGYFNLYDELGSTYIGTYNQNYAFGDLNIFNPSISTTTTTTTTTIAPTTTTTTTSTTTAAPTTSTTTSTTTAAPTTSTTTSTTTNLVYSQFTLGYSALNGNDSCAEFVLTPTSFYAVGGTITLVNGTILFTDTGLTTLVPDGFYSNGVDNWSVVSGNGTLSAQNSCALTTTTTTSTTTAAPTTTSTTTSTTTAAPTTSTTTSTTTAAPTTSTTTSTTTLPVYSFCLGYDVSSQPAACVDYVTCPTTTSTTTTTTTGAPVPYTIDNAATGSSALACAGATTTSIVYALAGYTVPIVGMIFYDSPSLTTPFIGSVGWRKFTNGVTNYAGEVDINGELTNYVTC